MNLDYHFYVDCVLWLKIMWELEEYGFGRFRCSVFVDLDYRPSILIYHGNIK